MNSLIRWIFTIPFAAIIIIFALYNRHDINLYLNPIDISAVTLPAYIFGAGAAIVGFIWGGLMTWLAYSSKRKKIREQKNIIKNLEKEIKAANQNQKKEENIDNKLLIGK